MLRLPKFHCTHCHAHVSGAQERLKSTDFHGWKKWSTLTPLTCISGSRPSASTPLKSQLTGLACTPPPGSCGCVFVSRLENGRLVEALQDIIEILRGPENSNILKTMQTMAKTTTTAAAPTAAAGTTTLTTARKSKKFNVKDNGID